MSLHDLYVDALKRWHKAMEPIGATPDPNDKFGLKRTTGGGQKPPDSDIEQDPEATPTPVDKK